MINFRCDQCNQKLSVSESQAGQKVKCSGCKNAILVPNIKKIQICKNHKETESQSNNQPNKRENLADSVRREETSIIQPKSPNVEDHISVSCSHCGKEYMISNSNLDRNFTCVECGSELSANGSKCGLAETAKIQVHFKCPACEYDLRAPDTFRGMSVLCPQCQCFAEVPEEGQSKPLPTQVSNPNMLTETTRSCPYCGEEILEKAKKCKHCGEFVENAAVGSYRSGYEINTPHPGYYANPRVPLNYQYEKEPLGGGWIAVGWIGAIFFPVLGFVMGIICCAKKRVGNGVPMIIVSILSFIGYLISGLVAAFMEAGF